MVASPEVCRQNGSKSCGPVTERGKEISSRNATKHGILAQQPPILATEDLESFQGITQGLIDEYQPQTPTEHLLIQQITMGWLRLHRLWGVEAATANLKILLAQRKSRDPGHPGTSNFGNVESSLWECKPQSFEAVLEGEQQAIEDLIYHLTDALSLFPPTAKKSAKWTLAVFNALYEGWCQCPSQADRDGNTNEFWQQRAKLYDQLSTEDDWGKRQKPLSPDEAKPKLEALIKAAQTRIAEIQATEAEVVAHDQAIEQARTASQGLQYTEMFARYETHINRQLKEALDRLVELQNQRKNGDPMGSFGQEGEFVD